MPSICLSLLNLVEAVAGDTSRPKTIALFVTAEELPLSGLEKQGDVSGDDLVQLCRICAEDGDPLEPEPMVLATWRPGSGAVATDADRETWRAMLTTVAGTPLHLVDWLLIDGRRACSLATGCRWQTR